MYRTSIDPIDAATVNKNKKKRGYPFEAPKVQDDSMTSSKDGFETEVEHTVARSQPQIKEPKIGEVVDRFYVEIWPKMEHEFRRLVSKELERMILSNISFSTSLSKLHESEKEELPTPSKTSKFKLCFSNSIASVIFTNNEIKAEDGEPLKVAICDATNSNSIISTGPLSSALVEFFILHGEFDSSKRHDEEITWTLSDFNKSILTPRDGKRPLIVGDDRQLYLQNGVGFIKSLSITDNSSWMKSKMFRLGVKIKDESSFDEFGRVGEAVSRPFRVRDQRGEVNRKHHPPRREDEVWRLEGIGKDGIYHKNLSSNGILTVGDFLKAYHENNDPTTLRMMLGKRVLDKTWNMMINNALECIVDDPINNDHQTVKANNLVEHQAMGDAAFQGNFGFTLNNYGYNYEIPRSRIDEGLLQSVVNYQGLQC